MALEVSVFVCLFRHFFNFLLGAKKLSIISLKRYLTILKIDKKVPIKRAIEILPEAF